MKQFSTILILALIFFLPFILSAQGKTIEIKIIDKKYTPPATTAKIPQQFKDKGVRLAVRAGDIIRFCNKDKFATKPFSISQGNKFEGTTTTGDGGLRPGNCMTITVKNETSKPLPFYLYDEIRPINKLYLVILPSGWPDEGQEITPPDPTVRIPGVEIPPQFDATGVNVSGHLLTTGPEILGKSRKESYNPAWYTEYTYTPTTATLTIQNDPPDKKVIKWEFKGIPGSLIPDSTYIITISGSLEIHVPGDLQPYPSAGIRTTGLTIVSSQNAYVGVNKKVDGKYELKVPKNAEDCTIEIGADYGLGTFARYSYKK